MFRDNVNQYHTIKCQLFSKSQPCLNHSISILTQFQEIAYISTLHDVYVPVIYRMQMLIKAKHLNLYMNYNSCIIINLLCPKAFLHIWRGIHKMFPDYHFIKQENCTHIAQTSAGPAGQ